jgi:hypothetical protein
MNESTMDPKYFNLVIVATSAATDIWLGDDGGHLVDKGEGTLDTSILPGHYTVEFGLGTTTFPIHLTRDTRLTEMEIAAGPACPRPIPNIPPGYGDQ